MSKIKNSGFTLIELLVVISIIGFLATASMVVFNNARMKARDARRISDFKQWRTAIELYYDSNSIYPAASCGWALSHPSFISCWNTLASDLAPYLSKLPLDPLNGYPPTYS